MSSSHSTGASAAAPPVPIINPANAITFLRILSVIPFWYCVAGGYRQWGMVVVIVAGMMDQLDGLAARVFNCRSQFGEVFDAVADGIMLSIWFLALLVHGWVPLPHTIVLLSLGVINALFRLVYARRAGRAVNYRSFAMETFTANLVFLVAFAVADYEVEFYYTVCTAVMAIIVAHDAKRMLVDPVPS